MIMSNKIFFMLRFISMMLHNVVNLMTIQFIDTIFCGLSELLIMIFRKKKFSESSLAFFYGKTSFLCRSFAIVLCVPLILTAWFY